MHYWLTGHNELWRSIRELHPKPMAVHQNHNCMYWPYHHSWNPESWALQPDWTWTLVDAGMGTPFHMMNCQRWQTTGESSFVRFLDQVMDNWARNPYARGRDPGDGTMSTRGLDYIKVHLPDGRIEYPAGTTFAPANPADPPKPWLHRYRFDTYGGAELVTDWAQLTGSEHAVDTILLIGDYHAEKKRVDLANSDNPGGHSRDTWQLYRGLDALAPAYYLLRRQEYPERARRWKTGMEWRAFNYTYGSPRKLAKGAQPSSGPQGYTAQSYGDTGVQVYGQNGPKIYGAQAMINLYTLWFSRPGADRR
jgi:hypothetical protein